MASVAVPVVSDASRSMRPWLILEMMSYAGGALPVIMFIIGPRETHDHCELNL